MAKSFLIPDTFAHLWDYDMNQEDLDTITRYVRSNVRGIRRGDIIEIAGYDHDDRNQGLLIWSGTQVQELSGELSIYGHLPRNYVVTEVNFSPDWWIHYLWIQYWWPCMSIRHQTCDNIIESLSGKLSSTFVHDGQTWAIEPSEDYYSVRNGKMYTDNGKVYTRRDFREDLLNRAFVTLKGQEVEKQCVLLPV